MVVEIKQHSYYSGYSPCTQHHNIRFIRAIPPVLNITIK